MDSKKIDDYNGWAINSIAESVFKEMQEDCADETELEYYLRDVFRSVESRVTGDAEVVRQLVEERVQDMLDSVEV